MNYKFEHLNSGLEIINPEVSWTFAGFDVRGAGTLTLNIELKTPQATYSVTLSTEGQATDRSDEAISVLMNTLLKPYVV